MLILKTSRSQYGHLGGPFIEGILNRDIVDMLSSGDLNDDLIGSAFTKRGLYIVLNKLTTIE